MQKVEWLSAVEDFGAQKEGGNGNGAGKGGGSRGRNGLICSRALTGPFHFTFSTMLDGRLVRAPCTPKSLVPSALDPPPLPPPLEPPSPTQPEVAAAAVVDGGPSSRLRKTITTILLSLR